MCREAVRQLAEDRLPARATKAQRARLRRIAAMVSGAVICAVALAVVAAVLPSADLLRGASGVGSAGHLAVVALANTRRAGCRVSRGGRPGLGDRRCLSQWRDRQRSRGRRALPTDHAHCDIDGARHDPDYAHHFLRADVLAMMGGRWPRRC